MFAKNFARNYEKKIILGTSDTWLMTVRPSKPTTHHIEDCWIFDGAS